jgi:hypothetical protein
MPFGTGSVVTTAGKAIISGRMFGSTPSQLEPKYIAAGVGATGATRTAAVGDTALSSELAEGRTAGTGSQVTTSTTNDTYQNVGTITATGSRAVDEAGTFDHSSSVTMFTSFTFPVVNLSSGDSIAFTIKVQFT